jgi:hypothetical protein
MASLTPCNPQVASFYQCLKVQPLSNWECDDDGVGAIKVGFCEKEQAAAVGCMEAKMQRP